MLQHVPNCPTALMRVLTLPTPPSSAACLVHSLTPIYKGLLDSMRDDLTSLAEEFLSKADRRATKRELFTGLRAFVSK